MNIFNKFLSFKENSNKIIVVLVFFAMVFMFFSAKIPEVRNDEIQNDLDEKKIYNEEISDTEKRLEEILGKINGAGDVSVMIYYSNLGEKIVARDKKIKSEKENIREGEEKESENREESTVLYGASGNEQPFVTEERMPKPDGVLIIAEGAENEKVKYEISEAARALLGLSPNRIRVSAKDKAKS